MTVIKRYSLDSDCYEDSEHFGMFLTIDDAVEAFKKLDKPKCALWTPLDGEKPMIKGEENYIEHYIEEIATVLTDEEIEAIKND